MSRPASSSAAVALLAALFVPAAGHARFGDAGARAALHAMGTAAGGVRDYTMTLVSQEWKGDALGAEQTLLTKWARPFKVYYKRMCEPHRGREILYAPGWNRERLRVSLKTWPKNIKLNLDPRGDLAMGGTRHPVYESSLIYLVEVILENFRRADERREAHVEDLGLDTILGRPCHRVRVRATPSTSSYTLSAGETLWDVAERFDIAMAPLLHENRDLEWETPGDAKPGQSIRVPRYYAARIDLWIDDELQLPLRAEIYDGAGALFERFEHRDLRINVGLGPRDFSPDNPDYAF